MPTITAPRVAAWLINLSHDKEAPVSNLKLQKLLYYSQAWNPRVLQRAIIRRRLSSVGPRARRSRDFQEISRSTNGIRFLK